MNKTYQLSAQQIKQKELLFKLIDTATQKNIRIFITGGYGLDALYGELTRDHRDIDIYIHAKDEDIFIELLHSIGFSSTNKKVGEVQKREYKNPEFTDSFSIEYGVIEEGMKLLKEESMEEFIPDVPIGLLEGKPIPTFTLKAFKKAIEFNNSSAAKHTEPYRNKQWLDELITKLESKYL